MNSRIHRDFVVDNHYFKKYKNTSYMEKLGLHEINVDYGRALLAGLKRLKLTKLKIYKFLTEFVKYQEKLYETKLTGPPFLIDFDLEHAGAGEVITLIIFKFWSGNRTQLLKSMKLISSAGVTYLLEKLPTIEKLGILPEFVDFVVNAINIEYICAVIIWTPSNELGKRFRDSVFYKLVERDKMMKVLANYAYVDEGDLPIVFP